MEVNSFIRSVLYQRFHCSHLDDDRFGEGLLLRECDRLLRRFLSLSGVL